jgi:hypothetical protein
MNKRLRVMALVFLISIMLFGCAATLKDYKPKSLEEEAIKVVLVGFENAWNRHDLQGVLAVLHEKGKFMTGREKKIVSKKEYADILPSRMLELPTMTIGTPKIDIAGEKAAVNASVDFVRFQNPSFIYHMVKENNRWFIMSWEY